MASAAMAALVMKPKAWMKSANRYSLWSFPCRTFHPLNSRNAERISGFESLVVMEPMIYGKGKDKTVWDIKVRALLVF